MFTWVCCCLMVQQVQQSFILLNASLENLLASVPSKYLQG